MRVLHAVAGTWLERTQAWLYRQIVALPEDVESHVVCKALEHFDEFPFPRVHALAAESPRVRFWCGIATRLRRQRRFGYYAHTIRCLRPDLVHSHFGPTGWNVVPAVRRAGCRHVVTFYGLDVNALPQQGWAARYPELFAAVDLVLCEGPHMLECVQELGCPRDKLRLHRLGVDLGAIPFRPRVLQPGEPLRVLMAAAFREKKGLPYGIRALGLLRNELPLRVTVIGGAGDSDESRAEAAAIGQAVKEAGLADCIRMLGFQSHARLHAEAAEHHVLLQPSVTALNGDTEGGAPVSLIEMAASGMAIVSTRHCDIPDVIEDGVTGLLAAERDVQGLADCLQRLCAEPSRWP
ncbi:MAG TPA: glycosyltransferase, partial [Acetobacteraceae bacterium]|nr:glycosyltransferase [Acetobacteraceae bacterium]